MKQGIKAIVARVGEQPRVEEIIPDLATMQGLVDGYIETVPLIGDLYGVMVINEEGKLQNLPFNEQATLLANIFTDDVIVGTAVIVGPYDDDGEFTDVQQAVLDHCGMIGMVLA